MSERDDSWERFVCDICGRERRGGHFTVILVDERGDPGETIDACSTTCGRKAINAERLGRVRTKSMAEILALPDWLRRMEYPLFGDDPADRDAARASFDEKIRNRDAGTFETPSATSFARDQADAPSP